MQRQLCVTRLLQYYRLRGRHSELLPVLETLAKNKNMELTDVGNAEIAAVGAGAVTGSRTGNGFMSGLAKAAGGFAVGYTIGRNL
jgi:tRNA A37 threonylcarbamoyladenosine modification protein TsaB